MKKGQAAIEMMSIVFIIMLIFLAMHFSVIKRNNDVSFFAKSSELQTSTDKISSLITVAQINEGTSFNVTLPVDQDGCTAVFEVGDGFVYARCNDDTFISLYHAVGVTNGTSPPPFILTEEISIKNVGGTVEVTEK